SRVGGIAVPKDLIFKGDKSLKIILPRESESHFVDLAELSLIWPYNVVTESNRDLILENIEYHLLRRRGVIRYKGDQYYNKNTDGKSDEAEWTFGLAWLSIIYERLGQKAKAEELIKKLIAVDTPEGLPELYFSNSQEFNSNTPLGWSESLFIVALS